MFNSLINEKYWRTGNVIIRPTEKLSQKALSFTEQLFTELNSKLTVWPGSTKAQKSIILFIYIISSVFTLRRNSPGFNKLQQLELCQDQNRKAVLWVKTQSEVASIQIYWVIWRQTGLHVSKHFVFIHFLVYKWVNIMPMMDEPFNSEKVGYNMRYINIFSTVCIAMLRTGGQ